MAMDIVDLPTQNGDFLQLCKRLPEGTILETLRYLFFGGGAISYMIGILHIIYIYKNIKHTIIAMWIIMSYHDILSIESEIRQVWRVGTSTWEPRCEPEDIGCHWVGS